MSFYIRIDNPNRDSPVDSNGIAGNPVEGPTKVCLVTAFAAVVGSSKPAYEPDRKDAGKDRGVKVSLPEGDSIVLPFTANEFEEIVVDAERRHRIADFTSDHWVDRNADIAAIRRLAPV